MASNDTPIDGPFRLEYVTVRGFRSLSDTGPVYLGESLTVLAGENDGGKTAFIDALRLLLGDYEPDSEDKSKWLSESDAIMVEGALVSRDGSRSVRIRTTSNPPGPLDRQIESRTHVALKTTPALMKVDELREALRRGGLSSSGLKEALVQRLQDWLDTQPEADFVVDWRPLSAGEVRLLPYITRFSSSEVQSPTSYVQTAISREARRLLSSAKHETELADLGQRITSELEPSLADLKATILEYCPDLDGVEVVAQFDFTRTTPRVSLLVRQGEKPVDLNRSGEGRKRRIALAVHKSAATRLADEDDQASELILYDEPDTHLDYASQRELLDILDQQSRRSAVQVIVATHSLNFIDRVPIEAIRHFHRTSTYETNIETFNSGGHADELAFLGQVATSLGLRNSVLLDERLFLIVEGETEEAAIPGLFTAATGQRLSSVGISLFNTRGAGNAKRFVEALVQEWRREVVVILDADKRDELGPWLTGTLGLQEGDSFHFVGAEEFEDAFSDDIWFNVLTAEYPPVEEEPPWTVQDMASLRTGPDKFGKGLLALVRKRRRDNRVTKPDLGLALARHVAGDEAAPVPEEISAALIVAAKKATGKELQDD